MASRARPPPPPPAAMSSRARPQRKKKSRQPPPTTILDLHGDLLCEVFLRLPSLPSLVRFALASPTFLDAVRSSPDFRSRFSELHSPTVLGAFLDDVKPPTFVPIRLRSDRGFDPDHGAALRGLDAFLTRLPNAVGDKEDDGQDTKDEDDGEDTKDEDDEDEDNGQDTQDKEDEDEDDGQDTQDEDDDGQDTEDEDDGQDTEDEDEDDEDQGWSMAGCGDGYVILTTPRRNAKKVAVYNPLTGAMHLFPGPPREVFKGESEFHLIPPGADEPSFRLLCVRRGVHKEDAVCYCTGVCKEGPGAVAVLSPDNMEWQITPAAGRLKDAVKGTLANGSVYFPIVKKINGSYYLSNNFHVLDTQTLHFSRLDLPEVVVSRFDSEAAGETSDGKPCLVSQSGYELFVWVRGAAGEWTHEDFYLEDKMEDFDLNTGDEYSTMTVQAISRGTVYLAYREGPSPSSRCWLLSFCIQTRELRELCRPHSDGVWYPYIMAWPPSFVRNI